ncbi:hypothetical protein [Streptomyces sp. NPDC008240]|uniref:hypothetical protein n=1 Tax=Streptomyces sp. NPDC008240 TaxID=3364822 RepID=UPI0036EFDEAE
MTADQLALDDCEPNWDDLCDLGAQQLHDPVKTIYWDLRHQGLTPLQIHRIQTIKPPRRYL